MEHFIGLEQLARAWPEEFRRAMTPDEVERFVLDLAGLPIDRYRLRCAVNALGWFIERRDG